MSSTRRLLLASLLGAALLPGAAGAQAAPFTLVMLGDSLTAGFGLTRSQAIPARLEAGLKARGIAARVINAGASGETSADVLARLDFSVQAGAGAALVAVGGNDLLQGLPPSQLKANLTAIVTRLQARRVKVAIAGLQAPQNLGPAYAREFNAVYSDVARAKRAALYPFLLEGVALQARLNQNDGIHPNAAGAQIIADRLTPFVIRTFGLAAA